MSPELRAAADSFIYDVSMLLHVSTLLDGERLGRVCGATGWTLGQTLGHLAASYEHYGRALSGRLAGEPVTWPSPDCDAGVVEPGMPGDALAARMAAARREILATVAAVPPAMESGPAADGLPSLRETLRAWAHHGSDHALDFLETAPELAADPLILNWAYYPHPGEPPALDARRKALLVRLKGRKRDRE